MTSNVPLLEVRGLRKVFSAGGGLTGQARRQVHAVNGVDLKVWPGQTVGIVGESGCGKSTLARLMLGLYPPTAGEVLFEGASIASLSRRDLLGVRRNMQIVFQDPYSSLDPRMRLRDIIAEPLVTHGLVGRGRGAQGRRRERVGELLEAVGLGAGDQDRYPRELSGGQRQRVGIARALALDPRLLVLDEPVSALDVSIQAQVINLLARMQRERGLTYVFVTHDLSVLRHVADHVAVMYLGRVVEFAPTEELFRQARHPYTQSLLSAVPVPDPALERQRRRIVLKGEIPSPDNLPSGCAFHTRCPIAREVCSNQAPSLDSQNGAGHPAACHFPVTSPEDLLAPAPTTSST
ncbi:MAG TPA: ABC transporter ATP-binding protein [Trebonia sp.]|nr:ABC transporter ATP-binding protein [Trebonia sp.]